MPVLEPLRRSIRSREDPTPRASFGSRARAGRLASLGLAAGLLFAFDLPASADPASDFPPCTREPSQADLEGAAGAHKAAKAYYERGDYDKAIERWREAYSFDCAKPAVFLNLANAYEKKGDKASAIAMLELYLTRAKDPPDAATIATKVNNLKASLKQQPDTAPSGTATPPPVPSASSSADPGPAPTGTGPDKLPPPTGERPFGFVPWIVVGIGGAAVVTGVIVLVMGQSKISAAEDLCGPDHGHCPPVSKQTKAEKNIIADGQTGQTMSTIGSVVLGVGGAAILGGLAWQLFGNNPKEATPSRGGLLAPSLRVLPDVGADHSGLVVSGAF